MPESATVKRPRCVSAEEVAEMLAITRARVFDLARQGILPHIRLGRNVRFPLDRIEEFIEAGGQALPGGWRREPTV